MGALAPSRQYATAAVEAWGVPGVTGAADGAESAAEDVAKARSEDPAGAVTAEVDAARLAAMALVQSTPPISAGR
jgi:hypothetical protein